MASFQYLRQGMVNVGLVTGQVEGREDPYEGCGLLVGLSPAIVHQLWNTPVLVHPVPTLFWVDGGGDYAMPPAAVVVSHRGWGGPSVGQTPRYMNMVRRAMQQELIDAGAEEFETYIPVMLTAELTLRLQSQNRVVVIPNPTTYSRTVQESRGAWSRLEHLILVSALTKGTAVTRMRSWEHWYAPAGAGPGVLPPGATPEHLVGR